MILHSGSTSSRMRLAASSTSYSVMSSPPVMLISTPRAPCMETSSRSGLAMAASAASVARLSPSASPVPIMALPISFITVLTSAKSRLIRPGLTIKSVMPATPECSTSSAIAKASANVVWALAMRNRFWFGMIISVSTSLASSSMPAMAARMRRPPSKSNGLVITPTVKMPCSRAARAITGAAPVPVPPPIPAVTKAICEPCSISTISAIVSSAAALPISGSAPAPRPSVSFEPI